MSDTAEMPAPTAAAVLLVRDGAVLAISRRDNHAAFGLPCGKIEPGEQPKFAAVRELLEETGLSVSIMHMRHLYTGWDGAHVVATYHATDPGTEIVQTPEGVVTWAGWPTVLNGPFGEYNRAVRAAFDDTPLEWMRHYGSGTLLRATQEQLAWNELYLHERTAFEFGYGFNLVHSSRFNRGKPLASGDDAATTETCWWARALRWRATRDKRPATITVMHGSVTDGEETHTGFGILYEPEVMPSWVPSGRVLWAFTTDSKNQTVNPC